MSQPADPLQAVIHPDPYPYYAELVSRRALQHDPGPNLWIAADARSVREVLSSELCRVRPPAEPVPTHLRQAASGTLFGSLVRMNDGAQHRDVKRALAAALPRGLPFVREESHLWARTLFADPQLTRLPELALAMPVFVMGHLLGVPTHALESAVRWVDAYVRSVNTPALTQEGSEGASRLMELLDTARGASRQPELLRAFIEEARHFGCSTELIIPNAVGLITQAYEATAGLIGSTLRILAQSPELRSQVAARTVLLETVVREAARYDAPIQNTRRFVAESGTVAGQAVERGATILVLLAAANRDPGANPAPDAFLATRPGRCVFTFGVGPHACPGEALAVTIASAAIEHVMEASVDLTPLAKRVTYRPSTNARILGGVS